MYVLLDIEWLIHSQEHLSVTQLAALRVDDSWNVTDEFSALVCPVCFSCVSGSEVSLNGYDRQAFAQAPDWVTCAESFAAWLQPDDILFVWHSFSAELLRQKWRLVFAGKFPLPIYSINEHINMLLHDPRAVRKGLYDIAQNLQLEPPSPEHCARNDAAVLRNVLEKLAVPPGALLAGPDKSLIRTWNRNLISRCRFEYIFVPGSSVFHRKDCACVLHSRCLAGCIRYAKAADGRRPCRLCRPVSPAPKPVPVPAPKPAVSPPPRRILTRAEQPVTVTLITGSRITLARGKLVGSCSCRWHPGELTLSLMTQHQCIEKNCHYFQKSPDSNHWRELEKQLQKKAFVREQKLAQEKRCARAAALLNGYVAELQYPMEIIEVRSEVVDQYKIYYVSDRAYGDAFRFPLLQERLRSELPRARLILKHIKDVDGHFVTQQEFHRRRR